ncbi:uncharacterized protein LOC130630175 isoform X3 [Hydractinia symbiolongicarpus]|nr:uncharacterized protein LOC130630175 isoform X3 [Hydractinia symbiolongicarpus]
MIDRLMNLDPVVSTSETTLMFPPMIPRRTTETTTSRYVPYSRVTSISSVGSARQPIRSNTSTRFVQSSAFTTNSSVVLPRQPTRSSISRSVQSSTVTTNSSVGLPRQPTRSSISRSVQSSTVTTNSSVVLPRQPTRSSISRSVQSSTITTNSSVVLPRQAMARHISSPATTTSTSQSSLTILDNILPPNFDELVEVATAEREIQNLRNFTYQHKSTKRKRTAKPGPEVSSIYIKLYHLPCASAKPKYGKGNSDLVKRHFDSGYGFARPCYDIVTRKIKKMSISIHLNEEQFDELLHELFPHLAQNYGFFTLSTGGVYRKANITKPSDIKTIKYTGTLIVANANEFPEHGASTIETRTLQESYRRFNTTTLSSDYALQPLQSVLTYRATQPSTSALTTNVSRSTVSTNAISPILTSQTNLRTSQELETVIAPRLNGPIQENPLSQLLPSFSRNNLNQFEVDRKTLLLSLDSEQQLLIDRSNLVADAFEQYQDTSILDCKVFIKFLDEEGHDLDGLTKEFFSSFWIKFSEQYLKGENQKYFTVQPEPVLTDAQLKAVGMILVHGFLLTGYLPLMINNSQLFIILSGKEPSSESMATSFLSVIGETNKQLILKAKQMSCYDNSLEMSLVRLLLMYESTYLPSPSTIDNCIKNISKYMMVKKPYFALQKMSLGLTGEVKEFLTNLTEDLLLQYREKLIPSGAAILSKLSPRYSDDDDLKLQEETVFDFLHMYVETLDSTKAGHFLKFVTGFEVVYDTMYVDFNGEESLHKMIPTAHTCTSILHLSRFFLCYESFVEAMELALGSQISWGFSMI